MELLGALLAGCVAGPQRAIAIEAEAGVGKSSLLRLLQAEAQEMGFRLLCGAGQELERNRPFGVVFDLIRDQARDGADAAVFHELLKLGMIDRDHTGGDGFAVIEELVASLETCATTAPVLLCLDDLHWADVSTITAVSSVVRRLGDLPLLIALTMRPSPRTRELDSLLEQMSSSGGQMLRLPPLSENEAMRFAGDILRASPGPLLREQIAGAAGNPLFIAELLRALQQQGLIHTTDAGAEVAHPLLPTNLRQTLLRRFSFLHDGTLELLRIASILGPSFSVDELAVVRQLRPTQLMQQFDEAISAGLIEERGDHLTFRHELFRHVLYEGMPVALRTALHREAGMALAQAGAPVVRVAEQLFAGDPFGEQTVEWLWRAARESARRSTSVAIQWYERALNAVADDNARRTALTAELIPQLVLQGRAWEAQAAAAEAIRHTDDPSITVRLRVMLAHALTRQGLWIAAREQLDLAAAQYDDSTTVAVVSAPNSFLRLITGEVAAAVALAERSEAAARTTNNDLAVATCLMTRTLGASAAGDPRRALALGLEGLAVTERLKTSFREFVLPELCIGVALTDLDRVEEAERSYRQGFDRAARVGATGILPYLQSHLAILRMHAGNWSDAESEAEACLELASSTGTRWTMHARAILTRVAISQRKFTDAAKVLADAEADIEISGHIIGADWVLWAKALLLEAEGQPAEAAEAAVEAWHVLPELRFMHSNWMIPADVLRLVLGVGNLSMARTVIEQTESVAARIGTASATAAALRCRTLLHGNPETALAAVAACRDSSRPVEAALTRAQAARTLAETGHAGKAREQFRAAADAFVLLGLHHEENRLNAEMRAYGIRRSGSRPHRPATGWLSLTPTELSIARLVAQGLSNPQIAGRLFISRYTVETHLKHVFGKIGITSRMMLAAELMRHETR
jgi:DNA-binding CsgD family transcriptional regulator/tetratricopeptide (TPR) repeat protein